MVWCGVVWYVLVRCGEVWCGVVWCGVAVCGVELLVAMCFAVERRVVSKLFILCCVFHSTISFTLFPLLSQIIIFFHFTHVSH